MIAGSWDPHVTRVQETAADLWHAGDATDLLERALQTIAATEVVRDLALLSAREQGVSWSRLAEITGTTPNGAKHQHQRAAERFAKAQSSAHSVAVVAAHLRAHPEAAWDVIRRRYAGGREAAP